MIEKQAASKSVQKSTEKEISAGIIIYQRTREGLKFLLLYHGHGYWNFPKGKIESEEKSFQAAIRETREETGLSVKDLRVLRNFKTYERFTFRRQGKTVYKVVIFYLAESKKWNIRLSSEHQGYAWLLWPEASRFLGKYKDSLKVLKNANDFLKKGVSGKDNKSFRRGRPYQKTVANNEFQRKSHTGGQEDS